MRRPTPPSRPAAGLSPVSTPAPLICVVLCLALLVFIQSNQQPDTAQLAMSDADLALLEPASGGAAPAEGEHGAPPPKATGTKHPGPEMLPEVTIGGEAVISSFTLRQEELVHLAPEAIMQQAKQGVLDRTIKVSPFAHNPRRGPTSNPSLTVLEFTDLGCPSCMPAMADADAGFAKHVSDTLFITIHSPLDIANDTNLAAFYGKVAQRQNLFWEYRERLIKMGKATPDDYFSALIDSGADRLAVRRMMINEARRFYRELDADSRLARGLNFTAPPIYLANGVTLKTEGALTSKNLGDVLTYQMNALVLRGKPGL